jgi:hypothetical protein
MAKKAAGTKKAAAAKLPKTVAGVKVPKAIRESGIVAKFLNHPLGRQILADALVAAAGAAAAALVKHRPSARDAARAGEAVADKSADVANTTRELVQTAAGAVAEVVADAAKNILPASLTQADERQPRRYVAAQEGQKGKKDKGREKHSRH